MASDKLQQIGTYRTHEEAFTLAPESIKQEVRERFTEILDIEESLLQEYLTTEAANVPETCRCIVCCYALQAALRALGPR